MNILELSNKQRLTLLAVISVVSIATIYLVIQVVHKQYQPVFEDNNLANVAQVTTLLEEKGIPFELSNAGTRIEIPEALINQAKVDLAQPPFSLPITSIISVYPTSEWH